MGKVAVIVIWEMFRNLISQVSDIHNRRELNSKSKLSDLLSGYIYIYIYTQLNRKLLFNYT